MGNLLNKLSKIPMAIKAVVLVVICVSILGGFWWLRWVPQGKEIEKLERELKALQTELQTKQAVADNLATFQEKKRELEEELKKALKQLPSERDITQLLRDISLLAKKSGVSVESFHPGNEANKGLYGEIPINLKLEGSYHELAIFFDRVGKLSRIVNIQDISLKRPDERSGKIVLAADCTAKTFMFVGTSAVSTGSEPQTKRRRRRR